VTLEAEFHRAMVGLYEEAKKDGYQASYFLRMVSDHGGVEAAKRLVNSPEPSDGFTRLWEMHRLDLTVEALILEPKWKPLFSDEERRRSRDRLLEYGWTGSST
jgi:hypothetical protein